MAGLSVVAAFLFRASPDSRRFQFSPSLPATKPRHLDRRTVGFALKMIDRTVHNHRWAVYLVAAGMTLSIWGMLKIVQSPIWSMMCPRQQAV
ncbi:MAG: hypothetical protein R3C61_07310 [Bacteroidia bacterium]